MCSKKDFERAAKQVKAMREAYQASPTKGTAGTVQLARITAVENAFAAFFYAENQRFDAPRFRKACGSPLEV